MPHHLNKQLRGAVATATTASTTNGLSPKHTKSSWESSSSFDSVPLH
jgi:hypothetical protein